MSETNFRLHVVNCKCAGFYTDPRCRAKTMTDTDKPDAGPRKYKVTLAPGLKEKLEKRALLENAEKYVQDENPAYLREAPEVVDWMADFAQSQLSALRTKLAEVEAERDDLNRKNEWLSDELGSIGRQLDAVAEEYRVAFGYPSGEPVDVAGMLPEDVAELQSDLASLRSLLAGAKIIQFDEWDTIFINEGKISARRTTGESSAENPRNYEYEDGFETIEQAFSFVKSNGGKDGE